MREYIRVEWLANHRRPVDRYLGNPSSLRIRSVDIIQVVKESNLHIQAVSHSLYPGPGKGMPELILSSQPYQLSVTALISSTEPREFLVKKFQGHGRTDCRERGR